MALLLLKQEQSKMYLKHYKMNKSINIQSILILLFTFFISINVNSQSKKEVILLMTNQIDSLKKVTQANDATIVDKNSEIEKLKSDKTKIEADLSAQQKQNDMIIHQLNDLKDTLKNKDYEIEKMNYQLNLKNSDSLKYFKLITKLSEQNTFITDSVRAANSIKKGKIEPTRVENFYFKNHKSVITGTPDDKNRFTYTFELFEKTNDEYIKVSNSTLFNDKKQALLDIINQRIQKDYLAAYKVDAKCFKSAVAPVFDYKNLGIEFLDGKINFYASFDFANENCFYLYGYTSVEFSVKEIEEYLK
jgi:hypothetical protein